MHTKHEAQDGGSVPEKDTLDLNNKNIIQTHHKSFKIKNFQESGFSQIET